MIRDHTGMSSKIEIPEELAVEMTPAVRAFVDMLIARIEQQDKRIEQQDQRIAELEEQLSRTARNSSKPPSSGHPHGKPAATSTTGKKRKRGGQPGHKKHQRALVPVEQVNERHTLRPVTCRGCGHVLTGDDPNPLRHQVWELPPIKPIITEYQRHRLTCPCCNVSTCAELPHGVSESTAGPRLTATAAILQSCFRQSKRQAKLFFESVFNVAASTGWLTKLKNRVTDNLRPAYNELHHAVSEQPRLGIDETPWKESNKNAWMWTFVSGKFTVFKVAASRKRKELIETIGENYQGVVTSDRAGMYHHLKHVQYCWAHLKRDFQAIADCRDPVASGIGEKLLANTSKLFRQYGRYREGTISFQGLKTSLGKVRRDIESLLERGLECAHAKTSGTCQKLYWERERLWTFLDGPHAASQPIDPTNNASERSLRSAVIKRKLSFGTQSEAGSRFIETLHTVIETCRQQGRGVLTYVTEAVTTGQPTSLLHGA